MSSFCKNFLWVLMLTWSFTSILAKEKLEDVEITVVERPDICSRKTQDGDKVRVNYVGTLANGQMFDSSLQSGRGPFEFTLGKGMVIRGWDKGLLDMCIKEKRKLKIPPNLAYGKRGYPPAIPPNAVLIFETELVDIVNPVTSNFKTYYWIGAGIAALLAIILRIFFKQNEADARKEIGKAKGNKKKVTRPNPKKKR